MAFCFQRKESVSNAIRRLGHERIGKALASLKDCSRPNSIHGARKDIKKVRAVIRFVHTEIPKKAYRRQNSLLRDAARHLAAPRDAFVKVRTLRNLTRHFKSQHTLRVVRDLHAALHNAFKEETKRFAKKKTAEAVEQLLRRMAKEFDRLTINGKGWKALAPGVKAAYRDGQRAYRLAFQDPSPENFHEWRKQAKDLWYQVTLLRPVWPEQMDAMSSELEALGEYLGDDHDLVVLREAVEDHVEGDGNARGLETLNGLIEGRQRELRGAALELGARFYAEKPAMFCNRLAGYWETWRAEKKPCDRPAAAT